MKWMEVKVTTSQEAKEAVAICSINWGPTAWSLRIASLLLWPRMWRTIAMCPRRASHWRKCMVIAYLPIDESLPNKIDTCA